MKQKIFLLGYGTIGKCVLDILVHDTKYIKKITGVDLAKQFRILVFDKRITDCIEIDNMKQQVTFIETKLKHGKQKNLKHIFATYGLCPGDIVIDLTSCTGTKDIVKEVSSLGACYISTALEGWNGYMLPMSEMVRNVGTLREKIGRGCPTCILTHGMNPGMVSHFAIIGLSLMSHIDKVRLKNLYITEIDTQRLPPGSKPTLAVPQLTVNRPLMGKTILSTWGPQNFVDEMNSTPYYVKNGRTFHGKRRAFNTIETSSIYDPESKAIVPYEGYVVTHEEAFTINNYLRKKGYGEKQTVAFIYKPTESSLVSFLKKGYPMKHGERKGMLIKGEGMTGYDTVGVLLESSTGRRIWVGNSCDSSSLFPFSKTLQARNHNATTVQVAAGVLAGLSVIFKNSQLGFLYPEDIPEGYRDSLVEVSTRYYGDIIIREL